MTDCITNQAMLGSNMGACLRAECGPEYAALQDCMDPLLTGDAYEEELAVCGITP